jgi:nitrite reductase (NADH) large subunit
LREFAMKKIGIIGNGVSGTAAVREIRKNDDEVEIEVFTDERHGYYPKPHLMEYVGGKRTLEDVVMYDLEWYENQGASLRIADPVKRIDTSSLDIITDSGKKTGYNSLLIATGSFPFVPPFDGIDKEHVHVLRTFDDAIDIKEEVKCAGREIIVGGGILGIELAAAIKLVGGDPIVVTNIDQLLPVQLDAGASEILHQRIENKGVSVLLGFTCKGIVGDNAAEGVISTAGDVINGDLVVIATGVRSNTSVARESGIETKRGIDTNTFLETSAKGVFAAGDCMECNGEWYGIIPWALASAKVAAMNMLEPESVRFDGIIPSNTLKVAGIDLTSIGMINPQTPEYTSVVSVNREEGTYHKAVIKDNIVMGGISLGDRKVALRLRSLISKKTDITALGEDIFKVD